MASSRTFKPNPKIEKEWDDWSDEVLSQGKVVKYSTLYENGSYNWCVELDSSIQRFCKNMPEHIQRKLGVDEGSIVEDIYLHPRCYWGKKARAEYQERKAKAEKES